MIAGLCLDPVTFAAHDPEVMITCMDGVITAQVKAGAEEMCGRLITVCPDCTDPEVKKVIASFPNLTHGFCPACHRVRMAELEKERLPAVLTPDELLAKAEGILFSKVQDGPWRARLASDLRLMLASVAAWAQIGLPSRIAKANALMRIIERVAAFESIALEDRA